MVYELYVKAPPKYSTEYIQSIDQNIQERCQGVRFALSPEGHPVKTESGFWIVKVNNPWDIDAVRYYLELYELVTHYVINRGD